MADWAELHSDILYLIAGRLNYEDFVSFGGVCRPWKSVATKDNFRASSSQIPWLMLAEKKKDDTFRGFHSLSRSKVSYRTLPEAAGKVCYATQGWLVTVSQDNLEMFLLNPISRVRVPLPDPSMLLADDPDCGLELGFFFETFIAKVVLSARPNSNGSGNYSVSVLYGNQSRLAVWRSAGDFTWKKIRHPKGNYRDLIYYQGKLLAVTWGHMDAYILAVDLEDDDFRKTEIVLKKFVRCCAGRRSRVVDKLYLAECCGKLMVVLRQGVSPRELQDKEWEELEEEKNSETEWLTYGTTHFKVFELNVFELNFDVSRRKIVKSQRKQVRDLGKRALFLGHSSSICIDVCDESIKPNSIYFTDDATISYLYREEPNWFEEKEPNWLVPKEGGGKDMEIYDLKDGTIVPHFQGKSYSQLTPPIWIQPTF